MDTTMHEVLQFIEENDVKFIRLAFCDIFGNQDVYKRQVVVLTGAVNTVKRLFVHQANEAVLLRNEIGRAHV